MAQRWVDTMEWLLRGKHNGGYNIFLQIALIFILHALILLQTVFESDRNSLVDPRTLKPPHDST